MADPEINNISKDLKDLTTVLETVFDTFIKLKEAQDILTDSTIKNKDASSLLVKEFETWLTSVASMPAIFQTLTTNIEANTKALTDQQIAANQAKVELENYKNEALLLATQRITSAPIERQESATPQEILKAVQAAENFISVLGRVKADTQDINTLWEDLRSNKIEILPAAMQPVRAAIIQLEEATKNLGATHEANLQKQKEVQDQVASELLKQSQLEAELTEKEKERNIQLIESARIVQLLSQGLRETQKYQPTAEEVQNYINAMQNIIKLVEENKVSVIQLKEILLNVGRNDLKYYDEGLNKVQAAVIKLMATKEKLGATEAKLAEKEKSRLEKEKSRLEKIKAETLKIIDAQEKERQAIIAKAQAILTVIEAKEKEVQLQRQLNTEAERAVRFVSAGVPGSKGIQTATLEEKVEYAEQLSKLAEFVTANKVSAKQIEQIWKDLANNKVTVHGRAVQQLVSQLMKVKAAEQNLGTTAHKIGILNKLLGIGQQNTNKWLLSWRSWTRIIGIQLVHRAVSALVQSIREGITAVQQLQIKLGELQTISQNMPLTLKQWRDGLIEVSNAWGIELFDQVEGAYQTLSNQVAEGAETFKFLAETNRFAVTAVSSSMDAVNLLTATINSYQLAVEDANEVAASWFKTIELGRLRASDLATSLGDITILAKQSGTSLNELQAAISTITIQGVQVNKAMTQLRGIFVKLLKPTKEMKEFLRDIGVESGEAAIQTYGFGKFMQLLQERTQGSSTELAKYVNRIRGLSGALIFTSEGLNTYNKDLLEVKNATESYDKATQAIINTTGKKLQTTLNRVKNSFIKLGDSLLETASKATDGFKSFETFVVTLTETIKTLTSSVTFLSLAVGILGAKLLALLVANPFLALLAAATALGVVIAYQANHSAAASKIELERWKQTYQQEESLKRTSIDKIIKETENGLEEIAKLHKQYVAAINAYYNTLGDKIAEYMTTSTKNIEVSAKYVADLVKSELNILKNEISELQSNIKKLEDAQKSIEEREFDLSIEDFAGDTKTAAEKIKLIGEEIERLRIKSKEAIGIGNVETFEEARKRIIDLQRKIAQLEKETYDAVFEKEKELQKQREQLAKDTAKQSEKLIKSAEERIKLEKEIVALRKQAEKIKDTVLPPVKPKKIKTEYDKEKIKYDEEQRQKKLNELQEKYNAIMGKIAEKERQLKENAQEQKAGQKELTETGKQQQTVQQAINELTVAESKARQAIDDHMKEEKQLREQLLEQQRQQLEFTKKQESTLKLQQVELEYYFKQYKDFDFEKVIKGPDAEKQLNRQKQVLAELIALYKELGIDESTISELENQSTQIDKYIANEELRKQAVEGTLLKKTEDIEKDQKALEEFKKNLGERRAEIEKFETALKSVEIFTQYTGKEQSLFGKIDGDAFGSNMQELLAVIREKLGETTASEFAKTSAAFSDELVKQFGTKEYDTKVLQKYITDLGKVAGDAGYEASEAYQDFFKYLLELEYQIRDLDIKPDKIGNSIKEIEEKLTDLHTKYTNLEKDKEITVEWQNKYLDWQKQIILEYDKEIDKLRELETARQRSVKYASLDTAGYVGVPGTGMEGLLNPLTHYFAEGGRVKAKGTDTVPAMLTPGEFIMNASATKKFLPQLLHMNTFKGYDSGGPVSNSNTFGDTIINLKASNNQEYDALQLAKTFKRLVRQGLLTL